MELPRRHFLHLAAGAAVLPSLPQVASAQTYASKLVKIVVPFTPGSPVDVLARIVAQQLSRRLGQSLIIENRPGAGALTATKAVASAPPDGYTLLMSGQSLAYLPQFYPDLGFDPLKAFAPVATVAGWSHVMVVNPDVPAKTVPEVVAYAKANPGKLTIGYGLGSSPQILSEYFKVIAGIDIVSVPYRGGEQVRVDLIGGRIHLNFGPLGNVQSMIEQGQVRALAVTSAKRMAALPHLPTMRESGFPEIGFDPDVWHAIVVPAGTPKPVIDRLNTEINASLRSAEVQATFAKLTFDPMIRSPEEFTTFLALQAQKWVPVIKAANIQPF